MKESGDVIGARQSISAYFNQSPFCLGAYYSGATFRLEIGLVD
jgi:hypothetical protein